MKGRNFKEKEIAGIAMDIKAGNSLAQIMLSWECGHETVRRVKNAVELIDRRASIYEICNAVEEYRITNVMADFVTNEIERLTAEEKKIEEVAVDDTANPVHSSDFSINEIGYTLMRIETLLEEILKVWKV